MPLVSRAITLAAVLTLAAVSPVCAFTISGRLENGAAQPVAGADVKLYDKNGNVIGLPPVQTNAAGQYSIAGVPNDQYLVGFQPPVATHLVPLQVAVRVQNANQTVNAIADDGFILSGTVRNAGLAPVAGVDLNVSDTAGNLLYTPGDNTNAAGFYSIVLPMDTFTIKWRDVSAAVPGLLDHVETVSVDADQVINVTMVEGILVSGTVRNASNAVLAGVTVDFVDPVTNQKFTTVGNQTTALGQYAVKIPKGACEIQVKPGAGQLYVAQRQNVTLTASTTLNFTLQSGFSLSGTVTRANLSVVAGTDLDIFDPVTGVKLYTPGDVTTLFGTYAVVVPPGTWNVRFEPPVATLLVPQWQYNIVMNASKVLSPQLQAGLLVSGNVRRVNGVPVAGIDIDAVRASTQLDVPLVGDFTDALGNFSVVVAPDTYHFQIKPAAGSGLVPQQLTNVTVAATTALPQVSLQPGITVTGSVTDFVGTLLPKTLVTVQIPATNATLFTPGGLTDASGKYSIVLPAGTYRFLFTPDPAALVAVPVALENIPIAATQHLVNCRFSAVVTTDAANPGGAPAAPAVRLHQNAPNPFNPTTVIAFDLAASGDTRLEIFDARGRSVRTLVEGVRAAGLHRVAWDGRDARGRALASGAYFYRLRTAAGTQTRRMTLVR